MSHWTYVVGSIVVEPMGRTQAEFRYVLDTVLAHLPKVTGSERDMDLHISQRKGYDWSMGGENEFEEPSENCNLQSCYIVTLDASLRDKRFDETKKELLHWLCVLAKRVYVRDICVKMREYEKQMVIVNPAPYQSMYEDSTWPSAGGGNWCDYLMWRPVSGCAYPPELVRRRQIKRGCVE